MQILAFCLYFAVVLAIGIYFFLKTKGGGERNTSSAAVRWGRG